MLERLWIAAAFWLTAALVLGALVVSRETIALDLDGIAFRGRAVRAAYLFTLLGRWPMLLGTGVLAFGIAMALREGLHALVALLTVQVLSQGSNSLIKLAYRRPRPSYFIGVRDREHSYPSGHAMTAMVFFVGFAVLAWHAPFPRPLSAALAAALAACALGIPWSRLALGAHYVTDVIGGVALGSAWLYALLAWMAMDPGYYAR